MYGSVPKTVPAVLGVSLLPATGDSRPLFFLAAGLIVSSLAILVVSAVMARKSRRSEAN